MNSAADIWSKVLSLMEADMTATTIHTWFDDTVALSLDEDKFILHTPSLSSPAICPPFKRPCTSSSPPTSRW